jgi:hypothetical protein
MKTIERDLLLATERHTRYLEPRGFIPWRVLKRNDTPSCPSVNSLKLEGLGGFTDPMVSAPV